MLRSIVALLGLSTLLASAVLSDDLPLVIAHRGASGYLPEHTLPAVSLAYAMGADYIEQDVVLSKDSVPIVLHDLHLGEVTDVAKRFPTRARSDGRFYVLDFTLAELKTLSVNERVDAKSGKPKFTTRFPHGKSQFRIATLDEELELIQGLNTSTKRNVGIYPEIKKPAWHREQGFDSSRIVIKHLKQHGYTTKDHKCFLQCFDQDELLRIRNELGVQLKLVQLLEATPKKHLTAEALRKVATYADGIGPPLSTVLLANGKPTQLVKLAHEAGLPVHPYTFRVDKLPTGFTSPNVFMSTLVKEAKVDGLFTDFPDFCVKCKSQ